MEDLWPADIKNVTTKPPVVILKEQAALIGAKTDNLLEAEVTPAPQLASSGTRDFCYVFELVAMSLGPYRYRLFSIGYGVRLYPVRIDVDREMIAELGEDPLSDLLANNEDEFKSVLRKIFGSKKTRQVVSGILAQVMEPTMDEVNTAP
ncbi:hypothetical protein ACFL2Q_13930 [Thermodesulfobacteriota bacterium]